MGFIGIVVMLIILALVVYLIQSVIPMNSKTRVIATVLVVLIFILWLSYSFGIFIHK